MKTIAVMATALLFCFFYGCVHQNAQHFNVRGQSYYKSGDYQQALGYFLKYAQLQPNNWHPHNWLGWTYFQLKKYDPAIEQLNRSNRIKRHPSNYEGLGRCYYDLGNYERALVNFEKYAELEPNNFLPYHWLGWTYYSLKKYNAAIEQLNMSNRIKLDPDTYRALGQCYFHLGNYEQALSNFEQSVEMQPNNWNPYHWLGWTYYGLKKYKAAIEQFNKSNRIKQAPDTYQGMGQSYYDLGNYEQALANFKKYAELEPNNFLPYHWLGWTYYSLKKYNAAIKQFSKSNQIKRRVGNYQGMGQCYYDLGNYERALDNFQKYAELEPNSGNPYSWLGWTYYRLKKYDEAIRQLKKSNRIKEFWNNYLGIGESYYALGNYVEAHKAMLSGLEKIEDESSRSEMNFHLAYTYAAQGEYDKAYNILGKRNTFGFRIESVESGIKVSGIFKGGPADLAGLKEGDILTDFNGTSLKNLTINKFIEEILPKAKFGTKAKVRIFRNGSYRNKDIVVGLTPNLPALAMASADVESHEKPAEQLAGPAGSSQRWAVVVGISDYKDSRIPGLRYASRDARSFYKWLISPAGGRYAPVRVKLLIDQDATLGNMRNALFVWLKQAIAEDLVLIYFAGHGSPESPDSLENLFLLPNDADYDNIATTGFPMWDIETALKRFIRAKTAIVVADACHSAGVGQSFDMARRAGRGIKVNPINRNFERLANIFHGTCILTASADNQYSQESRKWGGGHGVFTYFLLEGLKGDSDYNEDGRVTLGELIPYISERVRRETRSAQSPTVSGKFDPAVTIGR